MEGKYIEAEMGTFIFLNPYLIVSNQEKKLSLMG